MLKIDDVNSEVYFQFRRAQMQALKTERLGQIHVSDIIKPCMRNVIYRKVFFPDTLYKSHSLNLISAIKPVAM